MTTDLPRFNMQRFAKALTYATHLHARQTRKGSDLPYISHLLAVSSIAMEYGASEHEAIAALLHDAAEDQGGRPTLDAIRAKFGDGVADIVDGCTDAYAEAGAKKPAWKKRKAQYIALRIWLRNTDRAFRRPMPVIWSKPNVSAAIAWLFISMKLGETSTIDLLSATSAGLCGATLWRL